MSNRNKYREGIVFSTDLDYRQPIIDISERNALPPAKQLLYISLDRKHRAGKSVTLIKGFTGSEKNLNELAKTLKTLCGSGGTAKDGEIIIQGDHKQKIYDKLISQGYKCKLSGG